MTNPQKVTTSLNDEAQAHRKRLGNGSRENSRAPMRSYNVHYLLSR